MTAIILTKNNGRPLFGPTDRSLARLKKPAIFLLFQNVTSP